MKKQGFAITGVLYVLLIIFLASLTMLLFNLQNRKMLLDQLKLDVVEAVESNNNYEYLLNRISELEAKTNEINNHITLIKTEYFQKSVTAPNNTETEVFEFKAPKDGLYILKGRVNFSSASGSRKDSQDIHQLRIKHNSVIREQEQLKLLNNYNTVFPIATVYYLKQNETISFHIIQQTGESIGIAMDLWVQSCE